MKCIKQPENWKVNMKKNARLKGEEYIGKEVNTEMIDAIQLIKKKLIYIF